MKHCGRCFPMATVAGWFATSATPTVAQAQNCVGTTGPCFQGLGFLAAAPPNALYQVAVRWLRITRCIRNGLRLAVCVSTFGAPQLAWTQALPLTNPGGGVGACPNDQFHTGWIIPHTLEVGWGQPPYSWTVTSGSVLPSGVQLDPLTGVIHGDGVPSDVPPPGDYNFSLTVKDLLGQQAQANFTLTVPSLPPNIACSQFTWPLLVSQSYNINFPAAPNRVYGASLLIQYGVSPYSLKFIKGSLPNGLSLFGGVVQGTPTNGVAPGPYTFTVQITDSTGMSGTNDYTIAVCGAADFPCPEFTSRTHDFKATGKATSSGGTVAGTSRLVHERRSDLTGGGPRRSADRLVGRRAARIQRRRLRRHAWRDKAATWRSGCSTACRISQAGGLGNVPTTWTIAGTADLNGDGKGDLLEG